MNLNIVFAIIFLIAFISLSIEGYKDKNYFYQFIAVNSFIALTNTLAEILPQTWNSSINSFRIVVGLLVSAIFIYHDFKHYRKIKQG